MVICLNFSDTVSSKLKNNNVFTIAKRNVDGQDMLYMSLKLTNGIWVLAELKIQPGNPNFMVSITVRHRFVKQAIKSQFWPTFVLRVPAL